MQQGSMHVNLKFQLAGGWQAESEKRRGGVKPPLSANPINQFYAADLLG
jgi:hypothetical protein